MSRTKRILKSIIAAGVLTSTVMPVNETIAASEGITFSVAGDCWDKYEKSIDLIQDETKSCKISYVISSNLKTRDVALQIYWSDYPEDGWEINLEGKSNKSGKGSFLLNSWFEYDGDCYDENFALNFRINVAQSGKNKGLISKVIPAYYYGNSDYC